MNKKRKDGYLCSTFSIDGKRYYVYATNTKELHEKELQKRKEIEKKLDSKINPTVREYYTKRIEFRTEGLKPNTVRNLYRARNSVCKIYIDSSSREFGEMKIKSVTSDDLRELQKKLSVTCKTQSINNHMSKLKHVFCDAVKERILQYNPFDLISALKRTEEKARDTYHRALTIKEQTKFFNSELTKSSQYYNVFRIAINTGMRIGEIGALKYKDIKSDYFIVQRTITRTEGDKWGIGEDAKTKSSKRNIPITDNIKNIIESQKRINQSRKGDNVIDMEELIFTGIRGGLVVDLYVNAEIKKICKHEGIEYFTSHAFRDTFATRAIESNMNPKTLQEILGHKDFSITMNLYAHVLDQTKEEEMKKLNILI